jgi:hypothetical protein
VMDFPFINNEQKGSTTVILASVNSGCLFLRG